MTAKDMFEELGYKIIENNKNQLTYKIFIWIDDYEVVEKNITFWLLDKTFELDGEFTIKELQAINKQVEELGWYDDTN